MAALTILIWRSWTSRMTQVPAWVRPTPMWCSRLLCRSVTEPALSTMSCRIRSWVAGSVVSPGTALGIVS